MRGVLVAKRWWLPVGNIFQRWFEAGIPYLFKTHEEWFPSPGWSPLDERFASWILLGCARSSRSHVFAFQETTAAVQPHASRQTGRDQLTATANNPLREP